MGIFKFLEFLNKNNFKIYIVSHKTKYPYLGGKYTYIKVLENG